MCVWYIRKYKPKENYLQPTKNPIKKYHLFFRDCFLLEFLDKNNSIHAKLNKENQNIVFQFIVKAATNNLKKKKKRLTKKKRHSFRKYVLKNDIFFFPENVNLETKDGL